MLTKGKEKEGKTGIYIYTWAPVPTQTKTHWIPGEAASTQDIPSGKYLNLVKTIRTSQNGGQLV